MIPAFKVQRSWAIVRADMSEWTIIGRFWRFPGEAPRSEEHVLYSRLFSTRAEARRLLKATTSEPGFNDRLKVVRVVVTVAEKE